MLGQQLFQPSIRASIRGDQADRTLRQPVGGSHILDRFLEDLFHQGEQRRKPAAGGSSEPSGEADASASGMALMSAAPCVTDLNGLPSKPAAVATQKASI